MKEVEKKKKKKGRIIGIIVNKSEATIGSNFPLAPYSKDSQVLKKK